MKENGYNQWTAATKSDGSAPNVGTINSASPTYAPNPAGARPGMTTTASPKSTYETPEERAKKQIYIVRQSSISNAVDLLSVGQKSPPDVKAVLEAAKQFEDYVFGTNAQVVTDAGTAKPAGDFTDSGDDIPF